MREAARHPAWRRLRGGRSRARAELPTPLNPGTENCGWRRSETPRESWRSPRPHSPCRHGGIPAVGGERQDRGWPWRLLFSAGPELQVNESTAPMAPRECPRRWRRPGGSPSRDRSPASRSRGCRRAPERRRASLSLTWSSPWRLRSMLRGVLLLADHHRRRPVHHRPRVGGGDRPPRRTCPLHLLGAAAARSRPR
jgi:hypothetical protein